ncbi:MULTISPECIES: WG repeat-containing protein [Sphingobacterium]|uniref:WG repeat-containing protein n=1 Tax=Sphingobacterium TaxID=28453 RepID=UPI0013DC0A92|nr:MULTISPECIES: WG repeat-containing protein [unclassified Sphingobacterium]
MKKITLFITAVVLTFTGAWAQSQKLFRIDYSVLAESDAKTAESRGNALMTAWVNKEYFRVDNAALSGVIYITHKNENSSFALIPDSEEYLINDTNIEEEEELLPIKLVAGKQKKIAGYNCKLAQLKVDYGTEENEEALIEIWYTDEIPSLYWGEFQFFKQLKGAVLSLSVGGNGFIASKVQNETLDNSYFEVPDGYTEMTGEDMDAAETQLAEDRFLYSEESGELFGMKDESDNIIIEPLYTYIGIFTDDNVALAIDKNEKYGAIDKNGKVLIPFTYEYLNYDDNTKQYLYGQNEKYGLLHKDGKTFIPAKYDMISFFNHGMAMVTIGEKSGLIDQNQKIVVPIEHALISDYNKTNFATIVDEEYVLYNITQKKRIGETFEFIYLPTENNLILAQKDGKYGYIDENGKTLIPFKFTFANTFSENMAAVAEDPEALEIYYIDSKGQRIHTTED